MRRRPQVPRICTGIDIGETIFNIELDALREIRDGRLDSREVRLMGRAIEKTREIVKLSEGRVWLISCCSVATERAVRELLKLKRVFEKTGIPPANAEFCRRDQDKARIAESHRILVHIDNSPVVMAALRGKVRRRILFRPDEAELRKFPGLEQEEGLVRVESWREAKLRVSDFVRELRSGFRSQRD